MKQENDKYCLVDVKNEHLNQKHYDLRIAAKMNLLGQLVDIPQSGKVRKISKSQLRAIFKNKGFSYKEINKSIKIMESFDWLKSDDKYYYIYPIKADFIKVYLEIIDILFDSLSKDSFKVYCYLLKQWNKHVYYNYNNWYLFSIKELCDACGYSYSQDNRKKFQHIVATLVSLNLIDCDIKPTVRKGEYGGIYRRLLSVNEHPKMCDLFREMNDSENSMTSDALRIIDGSLTRPTPKIKWSGFSFDSFADYAEKIEEVVPYNKLRYHVIGNLKDRGENEGLYEYYKNDAEKWLKEKNL